MPHQNIWRYCHLLFARANMKMLGIFLVSISLQLCLMSGARAESGEGENVVISCDSNMRWGFIAPTSETKYVVLQGPGRIRQDIDFSKLIEYGPQDERGNARRLKTKSTKRTCGPLEIEISAGWFNSDPMGASGADDVAVIKISKNGKKLLGPITLGRCAADCATSVTMRWDEKKTTGDFELHREYDEQILGIKLP